MNSLQELNNYSNETVTFTDDRPATIVYDRPTPDDFVLSFNEGQSHTLPVGINILDVTSPDSFSVKPSLTIVFANTGMLAQWPSIPTGCNVTNPEPGTYKIDNITTSAIWDIVKLPLILPPNAFTGTTSYTATISSSYGVNKQWSVEVSYADVTALSDPHPMEFLEGQTYHITDYPLIIDEGAQTPTWIMEITPSVPSIVDNIYSNGASGGAVNFNALTKKYSITGTKEQINAHLAALYIVFNGTATTNMVLAYSAINYMTYESDTKLQDFKLLSIKFIGPWRYPLTFMEDTIMQPGDFPAPTITDVDYPGTDYYDLIIDPNPGSGTTVDAIHSMSTIGGGASVAFDNQTKTFYLRGYRDQMNYYLDNMTFEPGPDWAANISLRYRLYVRGALQQTKIQTLVLSATNLEVTDNISLPRKFKPSIVDYLWATDTPQIIDLDPYSPTYTIRLQTVTGYFSSTGISQRQTYSYTGTKSAVNAHLPTIKYYNTGSTNSSFSYVQYKNNVVQYSNNSIILDAPDYTIDPNNPNPVNQTITVNEGSSHSLPVGIAITAVSSTATTLPRSYTIDVSSVAGTTVTWTTIPSGCTVTNPSAGIYVISGFTTLTHWNTIKSPQVNLNSTFNGVFVYTASLAADGGYLSWSVTATVLDVVPLSTPTALVYYSSGVNQLITGAPQIVDTGLQAPSGGTDPGWTITVTPNHTEAINTFTSTGGSISVDPTTKVVTITGTKAEINAKLAGLTLVSNDTFDYTFTLTYYASNGTNSETATQVQTLKSSDIDVLKAVIGDSSYSTNGVTNISGGPQLADNGVGTYTMTVVAKPSAAISSFSSLTGSSYAISNDLSTTYSSDTVYGISGDGLTAYVGDPTYDSNKGRILVYSKSSGTWTLQGTLSISEAAVNDYLGAAGFNSSNTKSSISANGNTIAIGLPKKGTFVYGGSTKIAGKVYIFVRSGSTWSEQAIINPDRTTSPGNNSSNFGYWGINLSPDGNTLASSVGGGTHIWIHNRSGSTWPMQKVIYETEFRGGTGVQSASGLANPTFPNGSNNALVFYCQSSTSSSNRFDTIMNYTRSGTTWSVTGSIDQTANSEFGTVSSESFRDNRRFISLSSAGTTLAAIQTSTSSVLVYTKSGATWSLQTTKTISGATFHSCHLSADGNTLLVSGVKGTDANGDPRIFLWKYTRSGSTWSFIIVGELHYTDYLSQAYGHSRLQMTADLQLPMVQDLLYETPQVTYDSGTKTLTISGTFGSVNGQVDQISLTPTTDYAQDFNLIYTGTTPSSQHSTRNQLIAHI